MFQKTTEQVYVKIGTVYNIMDILFKNALRKHELDEFKNQALKLKTFGGRNAKNKDMVEMDLFFLLFR